MLAVEKHLSLLRLKHTCSAWVFFSLDFLFLYVVVLYHNLHAIIIGYILFLRNSSNPPGPTHGIMSSRTPMVNTQPHPQRRSGHGHQLLISLEHTNRPEWGGCLKCHPFRYGDQEALGCLVRREKLYLINLTFQILQLGK